MSAKHTPGPWRLSHNESGAFAIEDDNRIAILCSRAPWDHRAAESIANGRLMTAAPELLSIARRWAALDAGGWHPDRHAADKAELLAATRAAIAKAEKPWAPAAEMTQRCQSVASN